MGKDPTSEVQKWPCEVNFLLHEDMLQSDKSRS